MVPRLNSLGLKINLALLLFFLIVGFATAAVVYIGFSRTRDNANTRSEQALEELGQQNLQNIANAQADFGALQLEWAAEVGHRASMYMQQFRASGSTTPVDVSGFAQRPDGLWYDPDPNRWSDLVVLPRETLDAAVLDDIAYTAALEPLLPALLAGFPHEISADSFRPIAVIFVSSNGIGRYYPPRGVHATTPANLNPADILEDIDANVNPERKTLWTPPYQDLAGQGLVITAQTPVYEGDTLRGLFEVDLSISNLVDTVNLVKPTENGFAFYVDVEGAILRTDAYDLLTHEIESQGNSVLASLIERMKLGERGVEQVRLGDEDYFVGFAPMIEVGGGFATVAPVRELTDEAAAITAGVDRQADETITIVLTSMAALFAVALVGATFLNRRVLIQPIEALVAGTRAVARGELETRIAVRGDDELAALGHSFNQMTAGILERDVSLRSEVHERQVAQEELRALFAAMTDRVMVFDREGRISRLPETNAPALGFPAQELLGRQISEIVTPAEAARVVHNIDRALSEHTTVTEEYSYVVGNRTYWFSSALSPISEDEVVMVARDITDRVNARQELERQVQERTQELRALLEVSRNVASTLELAPLLQLIIDQVKEIADFNRCSIFLLEGDSVVLIDSRSVQSSQVATSLRIPLDLIEPLWTQIAAGVPVIIGDVRADTVQAAAYRRGSGDLLETAFRDIHSWMGVPLESKERLIGMLTLSHEQPAFYSEHHAGLITAIAAQVAIAIENARLYEQAQQLAAVEERQRLARELHDSVSQALYGIALGARTARTLIDRDPAKAAEPVDYVLSLAEAGLAEMRALIFELRPESLEIEGLIAALDKQVAATAARYNLEVTAELAEEPPMSLAHKEIFYRIGQEALHNVVKHARASHVRVSFARDNGSYLLQVKDDGVGFEAGQSFPGHMGLVSMSERAGSIGARLEVESAPGNGTVVKLRLPVQPDSGT